MRQMLSEFISYDNANSKYTIVEGQDDKATKKYFLEGICMQADVKNHNGRIYPTSEIKKAVECIKEQIAEGFSVCGEADHPEELQVNIERISHMIEGMWMDGPNACGKLKLLNTPCGNIVKSLLDEGVKLGVSSRGSGNVDDDGNVSDFEMITVDVVMRPSAPNAYPNLVHEGLMIPSRKNLHIHQLAQSAMHDVKAQPYLRKEVMKWIAGF